jgi:Fic family protein
MELPELLHRIDELQARIVAAGPLSPEAKRKLDYRFRLDWNYHSNVMEGSSLTQQETRSIMMGNVTVSGKPIKDVLEMQGHDQLVTKLLGMAKGELNLSEARIREVHGAIVHEDDPAKQAQVGQWKKEGNYLLNFKGERFDFPPPEAVPEAMHKLLDRTKADIERIERTAKDEPHPALLAFRFHLDYVSIHPFHDGNGRTARIFCNLLLMRFGYPPVVIRVDEKETYNRYLAEVQAYGASPDLFFSFMAERLMRAQELVIDAIQGRSLEDEDDLAKRAELLFMQAESKRLTEEQRKAQFESMVTSWMQLNHADLIKRIKKTFDVFSRFFKTTDYRYIVQVDGNRAGMPTFDKFNLTQLLALRERGGRSQIGMNITFTGFKLGNGIKEKKVVVALRFQPNSAQLYWYGPKELDEFGYDEMVADHAMPVMKKVAEQLFQEIKKNLEASEPPIL